MNKLSPVLLGLTLAVAGSTMAVGTKSGHFGPGGEQRLRQNGVGLGLGQACIQINGCCIAGSDRLCRAGHCGCCAERQSRQACQK